MAATRLAARVVAGWGWSECNARTATHQLALVLLGGGDVRLVDLAVGLELLVGGPQNELLVDARVEDLLARLLQCSGPGSHHGLISGVDQ